MQTFTKSITSLSLATLGMLSILAVSSVTSPGTAQAYACKSYPTQAIGIRKGKALARSRARSGWSNSVKSQFGVPWSLWSLAKSKSITCSYMDNIKKWRCLASAKPCLYVVK